MTPRTLVLGATGQVGHALRHRWHTAPNVTFAARNTQEIPGCLPLNLDSLDALRTLLHDEKPEVIVNAAAYTAVDKAEDDVASAMHLNADVPRILAESCRSLNAWLIHYSTDYVFDGSGAEPLPETSPRVGPLSVYGKSKLAGEQAMTASNAMHTILRTSWVFSHHGHNFMKTILRLAAERTELKIVGDQCGAPTSAHFIAQVTATLGERGPAESFRGIFHLVNGGVTTWHGFAEEIVRQAKALGRQLKVENILPITTDQFPTRAQRPANSRLNYEKIQRVLGIRHWPSWQDELRFELAQLATPCVFTETSSRHLP